MILSSRIDRVRVYHLGATVFRTASVDELPEDIELPGLPLALDDATVKVRVVGADDVIVGDVRIGLHAKPRAEVPEPPDAAALKACRRAIAKTERRIALLRGECGVLGAIDTPARPMAEEGKPPPPSPMQSRVALETFTYEAVDARRSEIRALRQTLQQLREEQAALQDALDRAETSRKVRVDEVTKTVLARIRGAAKQATIEVSYYVPGARWAPQYQCRIAGDGSSASIVLRALICQASGEDWSGVGLELSTADPVRYSELPELQSIRIGKAQPPPATRGFRPPPKGAGALFGDYDRGRTQAKNRVPARRSAPSPSLSLSELAQPSFPVFEQSIAMGGGIATGIAMDKGARGGGGGYRDEGMALSMDDEFGDMEMVEEEWEEEPEPMVRAAAPAPPPAAARRRRSAGPSPKKKSKRKPGAPPAEAPAEAPAPAIPRFGELRLGPADSNRRNQLHAVDAATRYREVLGRAGLSIPFDVADVTRTAWKRAVAASKVSLPTGAGDVRSAAGHFDYAYTADDTVDVPSDGAFHSVPLGSRDGACELTYVVVPREDTSVFRVARVANPTKAPLLPGPVEVYVGGDFILSTKLPTVAPKQRFVLGLGVEQAIKCARNTRFAEKPPENAVGLAQLHHDITVELVNNLGRGIAIEVRERIPQPAKDAELMVKEKRVDPPWEAWDQARVGPKLQGGRKWSLELVAGASTTLAASYVIELYAKNEIVGGNRREA